MKTIYKVNEVMSNYSDIVGVFDTEQEATDYILEQATKTANENLPNESDSRCLDDEIELQVSYFSIEEEEVTLDTQYPDCNNEGEFVEYGNDIIDTFYNGNFSQGVKQLKEINATAIEFGDYIQELSEELGYESMSEFANNHFNYDFFICLGKESL